MNALHPPANEELCARVGRLSRRSETWVAILTGAGDRAFSAGNDLKWTVAARRPTACRRRASAASRRATTSGSPVIAAVNGVALGGGSRSRSRAT
jgi:enoyl-CoA hydratase/carnithine racemase